MYQGSDKNLGKCSRNFFDPVVDLRLKKKAINNSSLKKKNNKVFVPIRFPVKSIASKI